MVAKSNNHSSESSRWDCKWMLCCYNFRVILFQCAFYIIYFLSSLSCENLITLLVYVAVPLLSVNSAFLSSVVQAQMRDLAGFVETRQQLLTLKPNHRMNWIGFAVAHHLNSKYALILGYWQFLTFSKCWFLLPFLLLCLL